MLRLSLIYVWLCLTFWGQAGGAVPAQQGTQKQDTQKLDAVPALGEFPADKVPQDAIIVTIKGVCENHLKIKFTDDCKTTFTRAEFEKILDATKPNSPQQIRRKFAMSYAGALVKQQKALEMGLDKTPEFANRLEIEQLAVTHKSLDEAWNKQAWDSITDKQIEDYYQQNPVEFVEVDSERVFVPWFEPPENKKLSEAERLKADLEWKKKLKKLADDLHERVVAGEDCLELQKKAYEFTDVSTDIVRGSITLPRTRRFMLKPGLMPLMDLQPGQVTAVLAEDNGYYIFKASKRAILPLNDSVKRQIHAKFRDELVKKYNADLQKEIADAASYDEAYIGPPAPPKPANAAISYDFMPVEKQQ